MLARLGVSGILRLVAAALAGVLALWYSGVLKAPGVRARKAAWRQERADRLRGR